MEKRRFQERRKLRQKLVEKKWKLERNLGAHKKSEHEETSEEEGQESESDEDENRSKREIWQ